MEAAKSIPPKELNISALTARIIEIVLAMPIEERRTLLRYLEEEHISGRRKYPRKAYFMEVNFATPDRVISGYIRNISSDGMFVETREPFSIGQHVTLTFKLPNSMAHVKVNGEIVRVSSEGFGVKFLTQLDDRVRSREMKST